MPRVASLPGNLDRLPIIEGFKFGQFLSIVLNEICEFVDEAGTFKARHIFPPCCVEGLSSSRDCNIDVLLGS